MYNIKIIQILKSNKKQMKEEKKEVGTLVFTNQRICQVVCISLVEISED